MLNIIQRLLAILYHLTTYERGKGKNILRSKTLWVNVVSLIALISSKYIGVELTAEDQVLILGTINIVLRLITREEAGFITR